MMNEYKLEVAATEFLRTRGFRFDGRPATGRGDERGQAAFERRLISTPTGRSNSGYRLKRKRA